MPKTPDRTRSKQGPVEVPAQRPPEQEAVERAIEGVLDRLRPKTRRAPKPGSDRPTRPTKAGPRLSLVPDTGEGGS